MALRVKALAAKAYNLSVIHQVHMVDGDSRDNRPLQVVF